MQIQQTSFTWKTILGKTGFRVALFWLNLVLFDVEVQCNVNVVCFMPWNEVCTRNISSSYNSSRSGRGLEHHRDNNFTGTHASFTEIFEWHKKSSICREPSTDSRPRTGTAIPPKRSISSASH